MRTIDLEHVDPPSRPMSRPGSVRLVRLNAAKLWLAGMMVVIAIPAFSGEERDPNTSNVSLPPVVEMDNLTDLVATSLGVSVQFGEGKVPGVVRVSLAAPVGGQELWSVYHQILNNAGLTTVLSALPPVYHVVPLAEAVQQGRAFAAEDLARLRYQPGYLVSQYTLKHISAEAALKILMTILTGPGIQLRSMGGDGRQLMISAATMKQQEAAELIRAIDQPGRESVVRLVKPERTTPASLQASATAAWTALGRIDDNPRQAEILVAPDGLRMLLVASTSDIEKLEKVVRDLDESEPVEVKTYRPQFFSLDEVASLIVQSIGENGSGHSTAMPAAAGQATTNQTFQVIRDRLTGSLLVKATNAQHERIAALMKTLDSAPPGSRRQTRSIQVKHRRADEISRLVLAMISPDQGSGSQNPGAVAGASPNPQAAQAAGAGGMQPMSGSQFGGMGGGGVGGMGGYGNGQLPSGGMQGGMLGSPTLPTTPTSGQVTVGKTSDGSLLITADPVTNRLIILGEPRIIDQVEQLVRQLDEYQPQVSLEFILVGLTDDQTQDLGVELVQQFSRDGTSTTVSSLFGLSQAVGGDATNRTIGNAVGLGTVVLKPGDFAAVLRALETVNNGRSVIRSQLIVSNNAQATLNGVVQQPISSINSSTQVATTSYAGTSDAGTQITVSPQISPADYVTLAYSLSQSSFLGQPIVTDTGVIPPTKRNDNVSSIATVPDGHVIALGGLSNQVDGHSESRIPLLGSIPYLGKLFSSNRDSQSSSKLYAFIRVTVLRRSDFSDLRYVSDQRVRKAGLADEEPTLEAKFIR